MGTVARPVRKALAGLGRRPLRLGWRGYRLAAPRHDRSIRGGYPDLNHFETKYLH